MSSYSIPTADIPPSLTPQCTLSHDLVWELWLVLGRVCSCARLNADSFNSSHSAGQCHTVPSAAQKTPYRGNLYCKSVWFKCKIRENMRVFN